MTTPTVKAAPDQPERRATRIAFFIFGFAYAAWAPLIPFVKARSELDDGQLGLLLLGLGAGSIVAMPLAGSLAGRFGCRRVLLGASALICLTLPLLGTTAHLALLGPALFLFGAGVGSADCVANIQAVIVERASGRRLMSNFHGLFSVGGILGSGGVSTLLSVGVSPLMAGLGVVLVIIPLLLYAAPGLLAYGGEANGAAFIVPRGVVLLIGVLCFVAFLAEGAVLDWGAAFLTAQRGLDPARAGLGYTAFSVTMMLGRFTGDAVVGRLGGRTVLTAGALCAAAGFVLATLLSSWQASVLGYALIGVGSSNIVPVLYTAVGQQTVMPEHLAVSAISTIGYAGILAGPALIGFLAQDTSLSAAFLVLAGLLVGVAAGSYKITV